MEQLQKQKITKMGNHAAAATQTEEKSETFQEARHRAAFDAIGRQLKNLVALRLTSTDPYIRNAAVQWGKIIEEGAAS